MQGEAEADGRSGGSPKRNSHTKCGCFLFAQKGEIRTLTDFCILLYFFAHNITGDLYVICMECKFKFSKFSTTQ